MPYDHLSQFLTLLAAEGELARLSDEVQAVSEVGQLVRRAAQESSGGPALLFEEIPGTKFPLVANLFGGRRLLRALDAASPVELVARIAESLAPVPLDASLENLRGTNPLTRATRLAPRFLKTAFVQQVVRMGKDVDLAEFPFPRWERESAPTLASAIAFLPGENGQPARLETPILQVADRGSFIVHWTAHHQGPAVYEQARQQGKPMPVAIVLGADPALQWACSAPRPVGVDPQQLAAVVRGQGLNYVRGRTVEIDVPGDAELVIEGYVDPQETPEGHGLAASGQGHVTERTDLPRLRVTAITHRANPVVPVSIRHPSPSEADSFQTLSEALLEWDVKRSLPAVTGLKLIRTGELVRGAFASLRKEFPGQARQVMHHLWGHPWLAGLKTLVVVDAGVPLDDAPVWQAVATYADPERDVVTVKGTADFDDHSLWPGFGSKLGIDATRKRVDEGGIEWPDPLESAASLRTRLDYLWSKVGWKRS